MKITTQELRKINKEKVIKALYENGECNKNQLAQYTTLSVATCYNVLQELLKTNEVIMGNGFASTGGRKAKSYKLNENYSQKIMISFHREHQEVYYILRVYNYVDQVIYEMTSQKSIVDFEELCLSIQVVDNQFENIESLSISLPGVISKEGAIEDISLINGLEKLSHIQIKKELESRFHKKVIIENDVNVAVIGYYAHHQNMSQVALIYQPKEDLAGLSFIVNGQLMKGTHGLVGEIPFLPLFTQVQQYECLKTDEGIIDMLSKLIVMIMIMNDPNEIVIACSQIKSKDILYENVKNYIHYQHFIPQIKLIHDIKSYIFEGLVLMSRELQTTNLVITTQKVYKEEKNEELY